MRRHAAELVSLGLGVVAVECGRDAQVHIVRSHGLGQQGLVVREDNVQAPVDQQGRDVGGLCRAASQCKASGGEWLRQMRLTIKPGA